MRSILTLCFLSLAYLSVGLNVPPGIYTLTLTSNPALGFRHCNYVLFASQIESSDDFHFNIVPALNGNKSAISFQSVNFPDHFMTIVTSGTETERLGISTSYDNNDASFAVSGTDLTQAYVSSLSLNPSFSGKYISVIEGTTTECTYAAPAGDSVLSTSVTGWKFVQIAPPPPPPVFVVQANNVTHKLNRRQNSCHSDSGYMHNPRALHAQLIFGEVFEDIPGGNGVKSGWANCTDTSVGGVLDSTVLFNNKFPSMRVTYPQGVSGFGGVSNRGMGREGLSLEANLYEGMFFAQSAVGATVTVMLRDYSTTPATVLASTTVTVPPSTSWQMFNYSFTSSGQTTCGLGDPAVVDCGKQNWPDYTCIACSGEIVFGLTQPGEVFFNYMYLQPGAWGRFNNLPVLKRGVDTLKAMGVSLVRFGGTFSQTIAWKDWRGVPWNRTSLAFTWANSLISGWGMFEQIDMCNALGIEPIITLREDQTVQDWVDLVEYCYGDETTTWGAVRIADGHPEIYNITTFELGNEQYNNNFVEQVAAMEAKATSLGIPNTLYYLFPSNGGLNAADQAAAIAAGLPISHIAPDIHVGATGGIESIQNLFDSSPTFMQSAINLEVNAETSDMLRALTESADLNDWFNALPPFIDRVIARASSFCFERNGHFDGSPCKYMIKEV
jgi:Alpha-L-arabinofuranosidase B (ABFB) domain